MKHEFNSIYVYRLSCYFCVNTFSKQITNRSYFLTVWLLEFIIVTCMLLSGPSPVPKSPRFPCQGNRDITVDKRRDATLQNGLKQSRGN